MVGGGKFKQLEEGASLILPCIGKGRHGLIIGPAPERKNALVIKIVHNSAVTVLIPQSLRCDPHAKERYPRLIEAVRRENHPFYRERLAGEPVEAPLLSRGDILAANDLLLNGHKETARTSGSTGVPVRIAWSPERMKLEFEANQASLRWVGAVPNATAFIHLHKTAPNARTAQYDIRTPLDEQIHILEQRFKEVGAQGVTTYPTSAEALAKAVLEAGRDMSFITCVGLYAELLEPAQEEVIRQAFPKAKIWSVYSSMEFGIIAPRCPKEPDFHHILARKLGVEILNDRDEPAEEGEIGRLVITDYFNTRSPLIRYDIGDMAAPATCPCGNVKMPAISQLIGKIRGALMHRDGRRIPFTHLSVALRDIPGMSQYQVIQHEMERFELRTVREEGVMPQQEFLARVEAAFAVEFGYTPQITITPETEIERGPNGKFYASISKL